MNYADHQTLHHLLVNRIHQTTILVQTDENEDRRNIHHQIVPVPIAIQLLVEARKVTVHLHVAQIQNHRVQVNRQEEAAVHRTILVHRATVLLGVAHQAAIVADADDNTNCNS
jgi:hypothetical protein